MAWRLRASIRLNLNQSEADEGGRRRKKQEFTGQHNTEAPQGFPDAEVCTGTEFPDATKNSAPPESFELSQ